MYIHYTHTYEGCSKNSKPHTKRVAVVELFFFYWSNKLSLLVKPKKISP